MKRLWILLLAASLAGYATNSASGGPSAIRTYYVTSTSGDDARDGLTPETAWRWLVRVNQATLRPGDRVLFRRGDVWRGQLVPQSGSEDGPITYGAYGDGPKPILLGSVAMNRPEDWQPAGEGLWATVPLPLSIDVGNLVFDDCAAVGVKKWGLDELRQDGDYFYDGRHGQVVLRASVPPASRYRSIELALKRHIISQGGRGYVTYENLALRYGAAHGIGGGNTHHIVVRDCDISYIGGGHQFTRPDGKPVRFGNGVEFWDGAHDCLVEGCRLWEIYDAALTNQGSGTNVQENITYRRNVIWNSEYSFEYWNRPATSRTRNIRFEHNTCVGAGRGWGHAQRPDPNGRHLMFYDNSAATEAVAVRYNIFADASDSCLRLNGRDWTSALDMDHNCWFQPQGPILLWLVEKVGPDGFEAFQKSRGLDAHSRLGDPKFVDATQHDYRLAPDSPARGLDDQGLPAGALP